MIAVIHYCFYDVFSAKLPLRVAMFKHHCLAKAQVTTPPETWMPRSYCNISAQHTPVHWLAALKIMVSHFSLWGHSSKKKKKNISPKYYSIYIFHPRNPFWTQTTKAIHLCLRTSIFRTLTAKSLPPLMLHLFSSLPKLLPSSLNSFFDPSLASVSLLNSFVFF